MKADGQLVSQVAPGTGAALADDWEVAAPGWAVDDFACFEPLHVWCVEDG